jgi:DNA-directed RNA polymerase II subunit RPB1
MMLSTFHCAGVSSNNVTLSVHRLKEIINVATNIKVPSLSLYLESEIARDLIFSARSYLCVAVDRDSCRRDMVRP